MSTSWKGKRHFLLSLLVKEGLSYVSFPHNGVEPLYPGRSIWLDTVDPRIVHCPSILLDICSAQLIVFRWTWHMTQKSPLEVPLWFRCLKIQLWVSTLDKGLEENLSSFY
ncbi:hypothetical protein DFJ58DRAFT_804731 [Suillus subalutaceus]|uniref:uncharacterized protein n=1 Tax=Suillus subalutaceus TaxID=48586 RepID=UPI001B880197|nr:uncharacterized protein DFJ58DRAFT_804731 [Suillus subalutaceus]KAG1843273.1 hypothetical protein DFJ58DRAFT_804731 [Suillus subalutaceus]